MTSAGRIHFIDRDSSEDGWIAARVEDDAIGLALSLKSRGDLDVVFGIAEAETLRDALTTAIEMSSQSSSRLPDAPQRLRRFWGSFAALVVVASAIVAIADSVAGGLFALGFGSVALSSSVLMADSDLFKPAFVRNQRLRRRERHTLLLGLVFTVLTALGVFIEAAAGTSGWTTGLLAVIMAVGDAGFAVLVATAHEYVLP